MDQITTPEAATYTGRSVLELLADYHAGNTRGVISRGGVLYWDRNRLTAKKGRRDPGGKKRASQSAVEPKLEADLNQQAELSL